MTTGAGADKVLTTDASGVATWQEAAGGSLWTQTGDDIYYNTGNVAIGTSTPGTAKLKILGGSLDMSSQKITNLATSTAGTDAATKGYVDSSSLTLQGKTWIGWRTIINTPCRAFFVTSCTNTCSVHSNLPCISGWTASNCSGSATGCGEVYPIPVSCTCTGTNTYYPEYQ